MQDSLKQPIGWWNGGAYQFAGRKKVAASPGSEQALLKQLANSYLYKDILTWERIQKPDKLEKLVQALAFQTTQLISYNELGQLCGLNAETAEKYINLLEKAFIVFRLPAFSRNLRNELKNGSRFFLENTGSAGSRLYWRCGWADNRFWM